jgi:hypothetical protein
MTDGDFTTASIEGTFALSAIGRGGDSAFAALGLLTFDGRGEVSGSFIENRPTDRYGERALVNVPYRATCTVNPNGTGAITLAETGEEDTGGGARIAQELSLVFRRLDVAGGSLRTATATRLPDGARFNTGSLAGRFVGASISRGGQAPAAGFGVLSYDGHGGFSESNIANIQGDSFRDRRVVTGSDRGTYAVHADGTGEVAGGGVLFVITRATLSDGPAIAEEYAFFLRDLIPTTGVLFTGIAKRLGD